MSRFIVQLTHNINALQNNEIHLTFLLQRIIRCAQTSCSTARRILCQE